MGWTEIGVTVVVLFALLGMRHDFRSTSAAEGKSVEEGAGIEGEAEFEEDVSAAYPERKLAFVVTALLGVYCFATAESRLPQQVDPIILLSLATLMWLGMTFLWSQDRGQTARELLRVGVYAFTVFGLTMRFSPLAVCRILVLSLTGSMVLACLWEFAGGSFHPTGADYRLTGSLHPNSLARHAVLAGIGALAFWSTGGEHRKKWLLILAVALVVILLTKSRTSLVTFVGGAAMMFFAGRPLRQLLLPASLACTVLATGLIVAGGGGRAVTDRFSQAGSMGREEQAAALTGRLPLWSLVIKELGDNQVQGVGYGAFWTVEQTETVADKLLWFPRHAHSAYVETLLNLGLVGVFLVLSLATAALLKAFKLVSNTGAVEYRILAGFLAAALINGLAEAAFVMPRDLAIISGLTALTIGYAATAPAMERTRRDIPQTITPTRAALA